MKGAIQANYECGGERGCEKDKVAVRCRAILAKSMRRRGKARFACMEVVLGAGRETRVIRGGGIKGVR